MTQTQSSLLAEQDDEWQVSERRYFSTESMQRIDEIEGGARHRVDCSIA
ncbi:MAG: hypothetical protein M3P01_13185 [Actinomycetota bacterium]|nr:hypothetical protein [Actinomycetota bacterium]